MSTFISDPNPRGYALAYYYCDYADHVSLTPRSIIGSLIQQLLLTSQLASEIAKEIVHVFGDDSYSPTQGEFHEILTKALDEASAVVLIIDGLDECDKSVRGEVLSLINQILQLNKYIVKAYISSQKDIQIMNALAKWPRISLSSATLTCDIEPYITHATQKLIRERQLLVQDRNLEHEIIAELTHKANGM